MRFSKLINGDTYIRRYVKKNFIIVILVLFLLTNKTYPQITQAGADTVFYYLFGTNQTSGQSKEFFPSNVYGLPDTTARENVQSADPKNICSLGLDGEIIIGFKDFIVIDQEGHDFTIFENAFFNPVTDKIFAEPAKVAVSYDGINFREFPYNIRTLEGCAGKTPTNGDKDPFDTIISGGDKFDLSVVGLNKIKYIRITDITRQLIDDPSNPNYDPILSGFDLDAVVGLHLEKEEMTGNIPDFSEDLKISFVRNVYIIQNEIPFDLEIFSLLGQRVFSEIDISKEIINLEQLTNGVYFAYQKHNQKIKRFLLNKD